MIALSFEENKALLETEKGAALLAPALYLPTDEKIRARAMAYAENSLCRAFFALDGDMPVGLCIVQPDDQQAEILALAVAKEQRKLSRRKGSKKGEEKSNNYRKQQRKVGKIHRHIVNQRLDNLHKKSTEIANRVDVVYVETLNMKAIANKGFGNGKATLDNGYGLFVNMLEYKLADRGKYLVRVDKWYPSSQTCNSCGSIQKIKLTERVY